MPLSERKHMQEENMNRKRMNILFQCDECYAAFTGVSMTSLLENNRDVEDIHIYLINDCISEENQEKYRMLVQRYDRTIEFLDMRGISDQLEACGAPKWSGSYAAYGRLFALGLIREEIDRLLYLDSDTIVTSDLSELYNAELDGNVCAMVQDTLCYALYKRIGHQWDEPYFNSGVVLFDVAAWKKMGGEATVFSFITSFGSQLYFPDQDVLNYILKGKIRRISAKYNFAVQFLTVGIDENYYVYSLDSKPHYYSREEIKDAGRNAMIYHYSSSVKPWIKDTRCALVDQWNKYLQLSPWAEMCKTERRGQPFRVQIQEMITECTCPLIRKMVHKLYVHTVAPAEFWIRKRKASK